MADIITDITPELQCCIAEQVERDDLLAFRFTCRALFAAAESTFLKTFFTVRTHLFTEFGLQTLKDIAAEPRLAKNITGVTIVAQVPHEFTDLDDLLATGAGFSGLARWYAEQRKLQGDLGLDLLSRTFTKLAQFGNTMSLTVTNSCTSPASVYGATTLVRLDAPSAAVPSKLEPTDCDSAITVVLAAADQSHLTVNLLDLCSSNEVYGIDRSVIILPPAPQSGISAWQALRALKIGVHLDYSKFPFDWESLGRTLDALPHLDELEIIYVDGWLDRSPLLDTAFLRLLCTALPANRLRDLSLMGFVAPGEVYLALLAKHCGTLEELSLTATRMTAVSDWDAVISYMLHNMNLQGLVIQTLQTSSPCLPGDLVCEEHEVVKNGDHSLPHSAWAWEGKVAVHDGLQTLLASRQIHD